jgi:hypothetical protein
LAASIENFNYSFLYFLSINLFTESYKKVASRLCQLAKESGSRDNISVIVVYLKEPHLIATQSWPSLICENSNENTTMENLNVFDDPAMEKPVQVTMDALGNTNQVSYHSMQHFHKRMNFSYLHAIYRLSSLSSLLLPYD